MPDERLLAAFAPWMRDIAQHLNNLQYENALQLLRDAEDNLFHLDTDGWLHRTCIATAALVHQQSGNRMEAIRLYEAVRVLRPPPYEHMINQLGLAKLLADSKSQPQLVFEALEDGLTVADKSTPTALSLLQLYAEVALRHGASMPLRWTQLYLKACGGLGIRPREFDAEDPHSFTTAVAETSPAVERRQ